MGRAKLKDESLLGHVRSLLDMAEAEAERRPRLSERYVRLTWRIKTRHVLRFPADLRGRFCKKCFTVWIPGLTCRVRLREGRITLTCLKCRRVVRMPYKKKKGAKPAAPSTRDMLVGSSSV